MTSPVPVKTLKLLTKFSQDTIIELYDLDVSKASGKKEIFRFYNGLSQVRQAIVWQGNTYEPFPIEATGFKRNGQGTSARPTMNTSNALGFITSLINSYKELIGSVVTRHQVLARFLDSVNFEDGNNEADPTQEIVSKFIVEKASFNAKSASFELALPCESDGVSLPARVILAHTCGWQYRSSECSYTGSAVADEHNNPTDDITKDRCSHSLTGCKLRFGERGILPFGAFPSSAKLS